MRTDPALPRLPGWPQPLRPLRALLPAAVGSGLAHLAALADYPAVTCPDDPARIDLVEFGARGELARPDRKSVARRFSWGLPLPEGLAAIARQAAGRPVVEVGAGSGYWTALLTAAGVACTATDLNPVDGNRYAGGVAYAPVQVRSADEAAGVDPEAVLLMVWPPPRTAMASRALAAYRGDLLIYVGEPAGGACADPAFFAALAAGWQPVWRPRTHLGWLGNRDVLTIFRRTTGTTEGGNP